MPIPNKVHRTKRRLTVRFGVETPEITGFTRNISESGLFVETNRALAPGTSLQLEVHTADRVFELWAEVIWAKRYPPRYANVMRGSMGCQFVHVSQDWIDFYHRWQDETLSVGARRC